MAPCVKLPFKSKSDALKLEAKLRKSGKGKKTNGGNAYLCQKCGSWHYTSEKFHR